MDDKTYHSIYESLFRCALLEKEAYFAPRRTITAAARLAKCGEALRSVVRHGASRIKRKTARAVVDHITQILPGPDNNYVEPILQNYVKALSTFLDVAPNVENLATFSGEGWEACVGFCTDALSRWLDTGDADSPMSGASPAHLASAGARAGSVAPLTPRGSLSSSQIGSQLAQDFMSCLDSLMGGGNAPVLRVSGDVSRIVLQVLQVRQLKIGELQKLAFSTLNSIFRRIQTENIDLAKKLASDVMPVLTHWWQPRALSRDAMLNSVRDEMLKTIHCIHLYIDAITRFPSPASVSPLRNLEDLLDALWSEYSRRDERARLQLDDVSFTALRLPEDHPSTAVFKLRPHHLPGEQNWIFLENLALLESIYARNSKHGRNRDAADDHPPRKRRQVIAASNRLHLKVSSPDPAVRLTALQLIPFLTRRRSGLVSDDDIPGMLQDLSSYIMAKQGFVATWAMMACAR